MRGVGNVLASLHPGCKSGAHFTGSWVDLQGQSGRVQKISPPPGFDPQTALPITRRCTYWGILTKFGERNWTYHVQNPPSQQSTDLRLSSHGHRDQHTIHQWLIQEFCWGGGGSTNSVEDRGQRTRGSGGGSPLVRSSGGSCNLVQEISFHIVTSS